MKTSKIILSILIVACSALSGLSFYGINRTQYIIHHLITGFPELALSFMLGWIFTMILAIIISIEKYWTEELIKNEMIKSKKDREESKRTYDKLYTEFISVRAMSEARKVENSNLIFTINNLEIDKKNLELGMAEQGKALQGKDEVIERLMKNKSRNLELVSATERMPFEMNGNMWAWKYANEELKQGTIIYLADIAKSTKFTISKCLTKKKSLKRKVSPRKKK